MQAHSLVHVIVAILEMASHAMTYKNAILAHIPVIQMQHARIMLAHTHVNAIVDLVETELCARI